MPYGFYKIKDSYFRDFPSGRHMDNKSENRPYYLAIQGKDKIIWMVPISSKVDKYKAKISFDKRRFGDCITCCIIRYMSEERAVLIGNMIPVTEDYIKGEFTILKRHYVVQDELTIKEIKKRCSRYLSLVRNGKLRPYVDILSIENALINRMNNSEYLA